MNLTISPVAMSYSKTANLNVNKKQEQKSDNVAFTGVEDKIAVDSLKGYPGGVRAYLKAMKGAFGQYKEAEVVNVVHSYMDALDKVNELERRLSDVGSDLRCANNKAHRLEVDNKVLIDKNTRLVNDNEELKKQIEALQAENDRLKASGLKVAEPIDSENKEDLKSTIVKFKELADEMNKNEKSAKLSLVAFLTSGEGEENFLKQFELNKKLFKACDEGFAKNLISKLEEDGIFSFNADEADFVYTTMLNALQSSTKAGTYLHNWNLRETMKKNALALCEQLGIEESSDSINENINNIFKVAENYHYLIEEGIGIVRRENPNCSIHSMIQDGDIKNSSIAVIPYGTTEIRRTYSLQNIVDRAAKAENN